MGTNKNNKEAKTQGDSGRQAKQASLVELDALLRHPSLVARINAVLELGERLKHETIPEAVEMLERAVTDARNRKVRLRGYTTAELIVVMLLGAKDNAVKLRAERLMEQFDNDSRDTILWAASTARDAQPQAA